MTKAAEELKKILPPGKEGYGKLMDAHYYIKYTKLYLYYVKVLVNILSKEPHALVFPEEYSNEESRDLVEMTINQLVPEYRHHETSGYHAKMVTLKDAEKLVTLNKNVDLGTLPEKIVPYKHARDLVLKNPDQLCVIDCPCRTTKENPCYPVDVCLIIGEPFVSFVMEKSQDNPRRITQKEAVSILKAENERGHIHHAFFKDALGGRFYCLCNCCRCCCTAMAAHLIKTPMFAPSGYVCLIDHQCVGCGDCLEFCQFDALSLEDDKMAINTELCMGCAVCESKCPVDAISMVKDPTKGEPLDIRALMEEQKRRHSGND